MDLLRLSTIPTCNEIDSMNSRAYAYCYAGHRSLFGANKCDNKKTHTSICSPLWKDVWSIVFELSKEYKSEVYNAPLDLFFSSAKLFCNVEVLFANIMKVKVEFLMESRLTGSELDAGHKIGYDLINDFITLEKQSRHYVIDTIAMFPFKMDESRPDYFSLEILKKRNRVSFILTMMSSTILKMQS